MGLEDSVQGERNVVCVMDASGRLGMALTKRLLQRGYTVHAAAAYNHSELIGMKGSIPEEDERRLKVFKADPFKYQSIVDAMKGCSGLFYIFEDESYDEYMAEVEVRAAHNVLEACSQSESIKKVIFTSSVTAVVWKENRKSMLDLDERDWTDPNFSKKFKLWYALAKTLAEKTAWALAMDRGLDMVSVNAGLLTGPGLAVTDPYLKGTPEMYNDGVLVTVDVKFLVNAHIAVYEDPAAYGRYICFNHAVCQPEDAVKLAHMLAPNAPAPPPSDELRVIQQKIQNKKLNKIMVNFDDIGKVDDQKNLGIKN